LVRGQAKGPLEEEEFAPFVQACRVILGLNQGRDESGRLGSYMKFRDLEFPGYGCCYLTEDNQDVRTALEPGQEVLTFSTMREAARTLRALERHPEQAAEIGRAGRRRVLAEHTWAMRLQQLGERL
jgi:spore maturation protein CgeB